MFVVDVAAAAAEMTGDHAVPRAEVRVHEKIRSVTHEEADRLAAALSFVPVEMANVAAAAAAAVTLASCTHFLAAKKTMAVAVAVAVRGCQT